MAAISQDKSTEKMPEVAKTPDEKTTPAESETATFNVQYHAKRCQVSFGANDTVMVITIPMEHNNRTFIRGFLLDMYEVACGWIAKREQVRRQLSLQGQKFNFKQGISNILRGRK